MNGVRKGQVFKHCCSRKEKKKRRGIHQIKISEYSTDQQNYMQLSSSHILVFPRHVTLQVPKKTKQKPACQVLKREDNLKEIQSSFYLWLLSLLSQLWFSYCFTPYLCSFIF